MTLRISNKQARWLWLQTNGLSTALTGAIDLGGIIERLGFVQLDTIRNVTRAHHHILWSRNQHYREPMLGNHLAKDRAIFEHFTHDVSVLPMTFYPMWQKQFARLSKKVEASKYYQRVSDASRTDIKARIANEGPLCTRAFDTKITGEKVMWARPPHKIALDYMWYKGELATSHRENFIKFYDLSENVIPPSLYAETHSEDVQIDWLCRAALDRLCFGSLGDIQRFWAAVDTKDVKTWQENHRSSLVPVDIQSADGGWTRSWATPDIMQRLDTLNKPTTRLRVINPFDPAVRDRKRLARLFGFNYINEMFVPAAKRRWGYYIYPLLEGDRFVARVDIRAVRKTGRLTLVKIWPEPAVKWTTTRHHKLQVELIRLARLIGVDEIIDETAYG